MRTMRELALEAMQVQDACNLSGVVHGFSRAITDLRELLEKEPGFSTSKLNTHPICIMWASKISSLTGCDYGLYFGRAYEEVQTLSELEEV